MLVKYCLNKFQALSSVIDHTREYLTQKNGSNAPTQISDLRSAYLENLKASCALLVGFAPSTKPSYAIIWSSVYKDINKLIMECSETKEPDFRTSYKRFRTESIDLQEDFSLVPENLLRFFVSRLRVFTKEEKLSLSGDPILDAPMFVSYLVRVFASTNICQSKTTGYDIVLCEQS